MDGGWELLAGWGGVWWCPCVRGACGCSEADTKSRCVATTTPMSMRQVVPSVSWRAAGGSRSGLRLAGLRRVGSWPLERNRAHELDGWRRLPAFSPAATLMVLSAHAQRESSTVTTQRVGAYGVRGVV